LVVPRSLRSQSPLDRTLAALADPTRRLLIERFARAPQRASDACRGLRVSRPAVSKHLSVLRRAGLVTQEVRGRERIYRVAQPARGLTEARAYIDRVSAFWDHALDAFKAFAEDDAR
jgi:DNA-binding transcriptional ArsR family regulator